MSQESIEIKENQPFNFEKGLQQLTSVVEQMERGDLPLEQSLKYFEDGIALVRQCQQVLSEAEQKVKILTQNQNAESQLKPFEGGDV